MGLIYGSYEGRSDQFMPGSLSHETVFCPHGGESEHFEMETTSKSI